MKYSRFIVLALLIIIALLSAWLFLPTPERFAGIAVDQPVAKEYKLMGVKYIAGDSSKDLLYKYYFLHKNQSYKDDKAFLITSDPFIEFTTKDDKELHIISHGKIEYYKNDLWIKANDGKIHHWYISLNATYTR